MAFYRKAMERAITRFARKKVNGAVQDMRERAASRPGQEIRLLHGTRVSGEESNEQGRRPQEIADKLGLSTYIVSQIILSSRNRGKL
jgi:hypothetical protein